MTGLGDTILYTVDVVWASFRPNGPVRSAYPVFPTLLTSLDPGLEAVIVHDEPTRLSIQSISRLQARVRSHQPITSFRIASVLPNPIFRVNHSSAASGLTS
jgi:hypothetical protein